jgi:hypothetical protein
MGLTRAEAPIIKVGVLTDLSGPYRDINGPNGIAWVDMVTDLTNSAVALACSAISATTWRSQSGVGTISRLAL